MKNKIINKILEWITYICLLIAFLDWLFLGLDDKINLYVYIALMVVSMICGTVLFVREFPIRKLFDDDIE